MHALGIGSGADPRVIRAVAAGAENCGVATLWAGEHVVLVDRPASRYPYADDGTIAVPADADWLDPIVALTYAAAVTERVRLATGVLLLPEHNPVIMAKEAASLDVVSGGRFTLGVGIGWSAEEFEAVGVPFERRGARTTSYVAAMRTLWTQDPASYASDFVRFEHVRVNPKPAQERLPVVVGGNSDSALRRVAAWGDGWYGFNLRDVGEVAGRLEVLRAACVDVRRDRSELRLSVALRAPTPDDRDALTALGVDELVIVASPPAAPAEAASWVQEVVTPWLD